MLYTHSPPLLLKVLVLLVLIDYFLRITDSIVIPQAFSPANVVFAGIGVLLLVSIIFDLYVGYHDTGIC
jgi:hypothetical protein